MTIYFCPKLNDYVFTVLPTNSIYKHVPHELVEFNLKGMVAWWWQPYTNGNDLEFITEIVD